MYYYEYSGISYDDFSGPDDFDLLGLRTSDSIVGMALNGVYLFAGTSEYGYDAYFPKAYGTKQSPRAVSVDTCLGTSSFANTYRYYMFSPCIYDNPALKTTAMPCSEHETCPIDVR